MPQTSAMEFGFIDMANRVGIVVPLLLAVALLAGVPAFAQLDLTGVWNPRLADEATRNLWPDRREIPLRWC